MSDFVRAIPVILAHETLPGSTDGSYTDTPGDKGGPTKWGLSLYRFWLGKDPDDFPQLSVPLSFQPPETADQVRALTREQAEETYRKCWWERFGYGRVSDQLCATKVFDMAVNMRRPVAHRIAQQAANDLGAALVTDGVFGARTAAAINASNQSAYIVVLCRKHLAFYQGLVAADPVRNKQFEDGWYARSSWPLRRDT